MKNILITSVGRRNVLVEAFKETFRGKGNVIATDCSPLASALYVADAHYLVPKVEDADYLDEILRVCKKEKISGIVSLIDPEIWILSKTRALFEEIGVTIICSSSEVCALWYDKLESFRFMQANGIQHACTFSNVEDFINSEHYQGNPFPIVIKPRYGSASMDFHKISSLEELNVRFRPEDAMIIQEYLEGREFGVDCYVDMISGELVSLFIKEKYVMRAGETDKAISIKEKVVEELVRQVVACSDFRGPIDIDIMIHGENAYLIEVNPRFGGGYLLAHACGCNFPEHILNNLNGIENKVTLFDYEERVVMMKYENTTILKESDLAK